MKQYTSPLCSCVVCKKQFSQKAIYTHFSVAHSKTNKRKSSKGITTSLTCSCINCKKQMSASNILRHYNSCVLRPQCQFCGKIVNCRQNIFCNQQCAAKYNMKIRKELNWKLSTDSKQMISNKLKGRKSSLKGRSFPYRPRKAIELKNCSCCGNLFEAKPAQRKTCSLECARKNSTYRKIIHEYKHNNEIIFLESSWEVDIATWLDKNKIDWIRPKHISWRDSTGKNRNYFPDFYLPDLNVYLDPKNDYQISISKEKLFKVQEQITLYYGKVEYIKSTVLGILESNQATFFQREVSEPIDLSPAK